MDDVDRFFDEGSGGPIQIQLEQPTDGFRILRRFGYRDPAYPEPFLVPKDPATFRTDLASIPWFFAWLVPGLGTHLPAVLLHDGLVVGDREPPTHLGPAVDRVTADRILRDAMAHLGTAKIRRWIMWAAVTLATAWSGMRPRWRWRATTIVTVGTVVVLGTIATLDLFDVWDVLPWMGGRSWWAELLLGAALAVVIPLAISSLWGRRLWAAAAIDGVALALLFHVTLVIFALYGVYRGAERVVSRREGTLGNARKSYEEALRTRA